LKHLFDGLNKSQTNASITKNSKRYKNVYEILDQRFFLFFMRQITDKKIVIQNFYRYKLDYFNLLKTLFKLYYFDQPQLMNVVADNGKPQNRK
jgi:hypothetical protein